MSFSASYWEQDSFLKPYDLIVIGAGIVGLSSAFFYKQSHPHKRVAVLERGFLPQGASTRNAGFACVGSIGEHLADMEKESEENIKKRIVQRYRGLELLRDVLGDEAIGYEYCGGFELFRSREKFGKVVSEMDRFNDWMRELVGEKQVYTADEIEGYPVIHNRLEGALHPGKMMQALVRKVSESGVGVKWNCAVEQVSQKGKVCISGGRELKAENVLFAANGFLPNLLPDLEITPGRGFVIVTNELDRLPWKGIFHHDRGYIYFRNVGDRLLIGGARNLDEKGEATDQFGTNDKIKKRLVRFVSDVLKLPDSWKIEQEWSGIMGFTPTKTPVLKQLDEHRFIAAGLSGMGVAIGSEVGREAADMLS